MTPEEARQMIGLEGGYSAEELEEALRRRSQVLESKIERAPTPGLKEKYRRNLAQVEEAWEVLNGTNATTDNVPTLRPTVSTEGGEPRSVTAEEEAPARTPDAGIPQPKKGLGLITILSLLSLVLVAGAAGYWGYWIPKQEAAAARGGLIVKTEPEGATVTLGGEDAQTSPATFKSIKLGSYLIHITLDGYEPVDQTAEIKENEFTDLGTITLVHSKGSIQISSTPAGLDYSVSQNGIVTNNGHTPATVTDLPTGTYDVSVRRGDWEMKNSVTVQRNQTTSYSPEFATGSLVITSTPPGTSVMQGDKEVGQTPLTLIDVRPGSVSFTLSLNGYQPTSVTGTVTTRQQTALSATLKKIPSSVGQPWTNSLGMKFVPAGTDGVLFCIWDVRVRDYRDFVKTTHHEWPEPSFPQTDNDPAVNVSWNDAHDFCKWLMEKEHSRGTLALNEKYRLPTDAEWSRAAGLNESSEGTPAGKDCKIKGVYPWGNQWPPPPGSGNYAESITSDGYENTSPVGSFSANQYGLYDMGGNVWQWCEDYMDMAGRTNTTYNPENPRVLRGAAFCVDDSDGMLSSCRNGAGMNERSSMHGFRVVVVVSP